MKKGIIYTRVSCGLQLEGNSLDTQTAKCRLQAELADVEIIEEIQDAGVSGKDITGREGMSRVIEMIKNKEIDSIFCYSLSRLTRSSLDLQEIVLLCNKYEVSIVSTKEAINTSTSAGRLLTSILGVINSFEREQIVERISDSLQHRKSIGKKYTRITPYGLSLVGEDYVENPDEQRVIHSILAQRDSGSTYQAIANNLNDQSIPTRMGNPWGITSIMKIYKDHSKSVAA